MDKLRIGATAATRCLTLGAAVVTLFIAAQQSANAQYTILHRFGDGSTTPEDCAYAGGTLTLAPDGSFFGTTEYRYMPATGDYLHEPAVFQMRTGNGVGIVQSFHHSLLVPLPPLLFYDGGLVASTHRGPGWSPSGTIFRLAYSASSGVLSKALWYKFNSDISPNPRNPSSPLILGSDGNLYGTTEWGGALDWGSVYRLDPVSRQVTVVYSFDGTHASYPTSLLLAKDGNYYGTTAGYISESNAGAIFEMTPDGNVTILYTAQHGLYSPLIQGTDGDFYGTNGTALFKMTPDHVVSVLHTFGQGSDGNGPIGVVQGPTGNLYGVTQTGGTANFGIIYEVSTDGSSYNILHNFADGSISKDGRNPGSVLVVGLDNNLYGATPFGGVGNRGTIFRISP
jgi:uncharacterized repeat protein (TIGR03803 family)